MDYKFILKLAYPAVYFNRNESAKPLSTIFSQHKTKFLCFKNVEFKLVMYSYG
jgi:hypothetical protein